MMDRREFFHACAVLLGSSVLPIGCSQSGSDSAATSPVPASVGYSKLQFDSMPNTVFSVSHDTYGVIDMSLTQVDNEIFSPDTEQFSICLTGPDTPLFDEGKYDVYNDTLGNIELFIQPGDSNPGEQSYRAIFSLLTT